ncbi:hypothetical protein GTA08_BOTSDO10504 [Botryosphaeria dothidea]|uniref:Uncharacterized protein n=1 Tax=Botryosphaeria dothidea TaxID=55169 RepID=A0A8H4IIR5_9PEZI|nr:hypothetical protein GTA08_BOTSDO10504 [Botryosphaeria dothidea]
MYAPTFRPLNVVEHNYVRHNGSIGKEKEFKDRAVTSQSFASRPELVKELEETASQITSLYESAATTTTGSAGGDHSDSTAADQPPAVEQTSSDTAAANPRPLRLLQPEPRRQPAPSNQLQRTFDTDELIFGPGPTLDGTAGNTTTTRTLPPPHTYSFREPTFGSRLERAALERAYHVLSAVAARPAEHQRLFRICRHFADAATLAALFAAALRAPAIRPFGALALHLGGAGTHFASPAAEGRGLLLVPRSGDDNVRGVRAALETLGLRATPELEADVRGYAGVWLDSWDVERYLAALGVEMGSVVAEVDGGVLQRVFSRPRSRAADVEVLRGLLDGECEIAAGSGMGGPERFEGVVVPGVDAGVGVRVTDELSEDEWDRFCDFSTPWLADCSAPSVGLSAASAGTFSKGRKLIVDLERFIKGKIPKLAADD